MLLLFKKIKMNDATEIRVVMPFPPARIHRVLKEVLTKMAESVNFRLVKKISFALPQSITQAEWSVYILGDDKNFNAKNLIKWFCNTYQEPKKNSNRIPVLEFYIKWTDPKTVFMFVFIKDHPDFDGKKFFGM